MKKYLFTTGVLFLAFAQRAEAVCTDPNQYDLIAPFGTLSGCVDLITYLNGIFKTVIGITGVLAVVTLVLCGIKLMSAASASGKSEAKKCITNALFGVFLALSSWLILNTINPLLLVNKPIALTTIGAPSSAPVVSPLSTGVLNWAVGPTCPAIIGTIVGVIPPSSCPGTAPSATAICCRYVAVPLPSITGTTTPPLIPIPPPVNGTVWIDTLTPTTVGEGVGVLTVTVRRTGTGAGTVNYSLLSGSATLGADVTSVSGVLTFPAGVTTKTFAIPIIDDTIVENNEVFSVVLSSASGALALGSPATVPITIIDNDIDVIKPTISILFPPTGTVTTTPNIASIISVTEETKLSSLSVSVIMKSTNNVVWSTSACSGSTNVCPPLGGVFPVTEIIGPTPKEFYDNEFYDIVARACDAALNCNSATTTIGYTLLCTPSAKQKCTTLPVGTGAIVNQSAVGETNSYLTKITAPSGGGSVSITTIAPPFTGSMNAFCSSWLGIGIGIGAGGIGIGGIGIGGIGIGIGAGGIAGMSSCLLASDPCIAVGLSCPSGCAYTGSIFPTCYIPKPVVIASLSPFPGDISLGLPCGNGGSFPGATTLPIAFGGSSGCVLKPLFNYFINVTSSDGLPYLFKIIYSWNQ